MSLLLLTKTNGKAANRGKCLTMYGAVNLK